MVHCDSALDSDPINIDNYIPIQTSYEAVYFCENQDGLLEARKRSLMRRIYAASDTSTMAAFVGSVVDIVFHVNFQISHRWPPRQ